MATDLSAVYDALRNADAAGDTAAATRLAAYIKSQSAPPVKQFDAIGGKLVPTGSQEAKDAQSPTSNMSGTQRFLAGAGKATYDLARGAGQDVGLVSRQDVADSRALDAPLMKTGAGRWGYGIGTAADLLPAAFIPGANTLAGSAAIGAGIGLLQPSTGTGETLKNVGIGAAASPLTILGGRGAGALYQGGKAALEPLFAGGQQRVAARALQAFAKDPNTAVSNLTAPAQLLPGVQPTTAELANNAGLAQLERTLRNHSAFGEYANALTERDQANRTAMTDALGRIAGTDADMTAAQAARAAGVQQLYEKAASASAPLDNELTALLQRPSMQNAITRAQSLAAENGHTFGLNGSMALPTKLTGQDLQYLKMSLNDLANAGPQAGMGAHELGAVKGTLQSLNGWIQRNVPELKAADAAFADLSKPINRMQVGSALADKLQPALSDFGNNTRLNANQYAAAVRNGDQLAAGATGWKGSTLGDVLTASQMKVVRQVGEQLARRANAAELGRGVGSNTAQNLASQNVLRQMLGPLGLPQSMMERAAQGAFGRAISSPLTWATGAAKFGEPRVMDVLAQAALDPRMAAQLLRMPQGSNAARAIWSRQGLLGPIGQTAGQGLLGNSAQ